MVVLESHAPKFRTANGKRREKIVKKVAKHIERTWAEDVAFDRDTVISVCGLSAKLLGHSQIFLAYPRASIRQT